MSNNAKTIIDLSGIDLLELTPDNFREVTKAAGKNPDAAGNARGYRLRIPKHIARRVVGTDTHTKIGPGDQEPLTRDEARWERLREILAEFQSSQTTEQVAEPQELSNVE